MKRTPEVEAFCAEMNCDWQGEVPAIARCPKCNGRNIRKAERNDPKVESMIRGWISQHHGNRESVARWMHTALCVGSMRECRALVAQYGGAA